jgi:hypothetical protein
LWGFLYWGLGPRDPLAADAPIVSQRSDNCSWTLPVELPHLATWRQRPGSFDGDDITEGGTMKTPAFEGRVNGRKHIILCVFLIITACGLVFALRIVLDRQEISLAGASQQASFSGWLQMIQIDNPSSNSSIPMVVINNGQGQMAQITLSEELVQSLSNLSALYGRYVTVTGSWTGDSSSSGGPVLQATSLQQEPFVEATWANSQPVVGAQPWVTLLCRTSDSEIKVSDPISWFTGLMSSTYPGFDHYWRELSYEAINMAGSQVAGVYTLTQPSSYYWSCDTSCSMNWSVFEDCTAAADDDVFFPDFVGITIILPAPVGSKPAGAYTYPPIVPVTLDGQTRTYPIIFIPTDKPSHELLAHELGHGLGLPHSSGMYDTAYDSGWDVMSGARFGYPCLIPSDPEFGCVGQHTIAYHKDMLGWIPASRIFTATSGITQTITIDPLKGPLDASSNYLYAKIPFLVPPWYYAWYSIEARKKEGYDEGIPGKAIVIHEVNQYKYGLDRTARVVDIDNNGNPNDSGAMWLPGETFVDVAHKIVICVESETPSGGFTVTVGKDASTCGVTFQSTYLPVVIR